MRTLLLFIHLFSAGLFYAQQQAYSGKVKLAIETYAFLKGQNAALKKIAVQFPDTKKKKWRQWREMRRLCLEGLKEI